RDVGIKIAEIGIFSLPEFFNAHAKCMNFCRGVSFTWFVIPNKVYEWISFGITANYFISSINRPVADYCPLQWSYGLINYRLNCELNAILLVARCSHKHICFVVTLHFP